MKKTFLFILTLIIFSSCTAEHIDVHNCIQNESHGFLYGLWHGIIAPITFIVSLFSDNVEMYSINNNGGWYNFGFVLGAGILTFGSSKSKS